MPLIRGDVEYLSSTESEETLGVTFITFKGIANEFKLKRERFKGQGQRVFYKRSVIERIRDTPESELPMLKKALIEEGETVEE